MKNHIKLLLTDLDGVLTDGGIYYTATGEFAKRFHIHDGMGMVLVRQAGIETGIITSEESELVRRRAARLQVDHLYMGKQLGSKLPTMEAHCTRKGISMEEIAYMGDDINCKDLLERVGYPACPADAQGCIKRVASIYVAQRRGGQGALREWINYLFKQQSFAVHPSRYDNLL